MLKGEFEQAWLESDNIARRGKPDPNRFWDGEALNGRRVLIRCLHGLGDTLQFIRYAPLVRKQARSLVIEAQPKMKALLELSGLADQVITWGDEEPPWDQQIEVVELPRVFRTGLASIPNGVPYLRAPLAQSQNTSSAVLRVGVFWNASSFDPQRSLPVELIARWLDIPGVSFLNLQFGPPRFELDGMPRLREEEQSIFATAGVVGSLDLVISVDTMMAHLAGALGRPVWTLLSYRCDWRWMLAREDTPWYPSMRLFRQPEPGSWEAVVESVREELIALASTALARKSEIKR